jgi:hypothetical protein
MPADSATVLEVLDWVRSGVRLRGDTADDEALETVSAHITATDVRLLELEREVEQLRAGVRPQPQKGANP